jgi:hypothetical protein
MFHVRVEKNEPGILCTGARRRKVGCQGDQVLVLRRNQVRILGVFSSGSQEELGLGFKEEPGLESRWVQQNTQYRFQARVSRRYSLGSQEESGEDSRGVHRMQSGRTSQRRSVDPALVLRRNPLSIQ